MWLCLAGENRCDLVNRTQWDWVGEFIQNCSRYRNQILVEMENGERPRYGVANLRSRCMNEQMYTIFKYLLPEDYNATGSTAPLHTLLVLPFHQGRHRGGISEEFFSRDALLSLPNKLRTKSESGAEVIQDFRLL